MSLFLKLYNNFIPMTTKNFDDQIANKNILIKSQLLIFSVTAKLVTSLILS